MDFEKAFDSIYLRATEILSRLTNHIYKAAKPSIKICDDIPEFQLPKEYDKEKPYPSSSL